jgi:hypothetical protein
VSQRATTWPRAALAVLAGALVCCVVIAAVFALRYRGAFGVFTEEDWLQLAPDVRGWAVDYALGLALAVGLWAVLSAEQRNSFIWAVAIGAFAMVAAPQVLAVLYVLTLPIPIDWGVMATSAVRRAALPLATGATAGSVMWRIAYGGPSRLA